jgi:hypothetical protein
MRSIIVRGLRGTSFVLLAMLGHCAPENATQPGGRQATASEPGSTLSLSQLTTAPEVRFQFGVAGELTVSGQGAVSRFPVPEQPRHFQDRAEFVRFAQQHLNALPTTDERSGEQGIRVLARGSGRSYYWNSETEQAVEVRDYVAAFLGGRFGAVWIAGERIALREEAPRVFNVVPITRGRFKLEGLTSLTHAWFYHNVGTDSRDQTTGTKDPSRNLSVNATWQGSGFFQTCGQTVIGQDFATCTISEVFTCNTACRVSCNRGQHALSDTGELFLSPLNVSTAEPSGC